MARVIIFLLIFFMLPGCDDPEDPGTHCACTEEFRTIRFAVVDRNGIREPGVAVFVLQRRTQELFDVLQPDSDEGTYSVVDDGFASRIAAGGDTLLVLGAKDSRRFAVDFVIGVDVPCRCHVHKIAGPDSVVLE